MEMEELKMRLSLCVIAKNEEKRIDEFFKNVRSLVDEIVLVDTGSNDRTIDIAKQKADKVIKLDFFDSFSAARNISLENASGDWALILDIDEIIFASDFIKIRDEIAKERGEAYRLPRYNYIGNGCWSTSSIYKLVKLGKGIRYSRKVHESIRDSLTNSEVETLPAIVHHFPDASNQKNTLYSRWLKDYLRDNPSDIHAQTHLIRELFVIGKIDEAFKVAQEVEACRNDDDRLYTYLGYMYIQLNELERAEKCFNRIYKNLDKKTNTLPDSVAAGLSIIYYKMQQYEESLRICLKQINKTPNMAHLYLNCAANYFSLGKEEEGKKYFEKASQLNPLIKSNRIFFSKNLMKNSIYAFDNVVLEDCYSLYKNKGGNKND